MKKSFFAIFGLLLLAGCSQKNTMIITEETPRGIAQAAALWTPQDGSQEDFEQLVKDYYCETDSERLVLFESLSRIFENLYQSADLLTVELLRPTQLTNASEPQAPDWIMSGYSPLAHLSDDLFANKLAFITIINFPHYTLEEKNTLGRQWTRQEWAFARMGDIFTTRVPAEVNTRMAQALADAENYIADYNIYMGNLRTEDNRQLWDNDKVLLSHWNLRDELKALYGVEGGQEKQEMIYQVMQRIVNQTIPQEAINGENFVWKPYSDVSDSEPYTRYEKILNIAHAYFAEDKYCPSAPTGIIRNFEEGVEIPAAELDSLFRALVGSPQVQKVASVIRERLGRELRPYDIWYDGFKARATLNEDELTALTRKLYPDANAFAADMPRLLTQLGFYSEDARNIANHIVVEPARGSGHAWPCLGRKEDARLRTRIPATGMDYKGYNIAVHEFGHCVEQVLDMYFIDHYMLSGVPNTAYTEASAFLWQQRDLQLLPKSPITNRQSQISKDEVFDQLWSMYEIMGVSLVDMAMWKWIYAHPKATPKELCEATMTIAKDIWNTYYEPVLGEHDCILLAVYSHMVNAPMYLPNYPLGHIVQYQLEEHLAKCATPKDFAQEYARIYRLGRLTPKEWMIQAVGAAPSIEPILRAVDSFN
ncbi:MAG: lipoprotein [Paludibacteraceae bacterium]|nr:lipoprotein [Paludibacteraceae bacterium]